MTDWNSDPNMAGEMASQLKSRASMKERAHRGVESRERQAFLKQLAIDVGELRQVGIKVVLPLLDRRVQHLEKLAQPQAGVASVRVGALGDERREDVPGFEDAGVVGKQAEHQPHEKPLQVVPGIAGFLQGVVQLAHHLRGFDIDRVLVAEGALLDAEDEGEVLYVLGELAGARIGSRCSLRDRIARRFGNRLPARSGEARAP